MNSGTAATPWPAPQAQGPVRGRVELPGSKSVTNRALVIAALADGPSRLIGPLRARDTELMAAALRALGVRVSDDGADWLLTPGAFGAADIDVGLAGTVMRFLPPVAALADGPVHFDGDGYARERPMAVVIDALRQLAVRVDDDDRGRLPFVVHGAGGVTGGTVRIDASASSQFVSGLLLAAARFDKGVEVLHVGDAAVPSAPHIAMTLEMLAEAGVDADATGTGTWRVLPGEVLGRDWVIEPDLSNAAPFLAAALVTGGEVTVARWPARTTQAGDALRDLLRTMGADVSWTPGGLTVRGTGAVHGLDADLHDVGELTPTLAVVAALADGPSRLTGIAHLRGHETDRLEALRAQLTGLGADVEVLADGLAIRPRPLRGGTWRAYADHRMATAGAVLGLVIDGVVVDDVASTSKTMPGFTTLWSQLLAA